MYNIPDIFYVNINYIVSKKVSAQAAMENTPEKAGKGLFFNLFGNHADKVNASYG